MLLAKAYFTDTSIFSNPDIFQKYYKKVSNYRKEKIDRLKLSGKENSLGVELLLQKALTDFQIPDTFFDREIGVFENEKPYLKNHPEIHFNLSHAGSRGFCLISNFECGCDVENVNPKKFNINLVKRFFSQEELNQIQSLEEKSLQISLFFDFWTRKEAYGKLNGEGINYIISNKTDFSYLEKFEKENNCSFMIYEEENKKASQMYKYCAVCKNPQNLPKTELFESKMIKVTFN